ncbi:hypothetical protein BO70DRAFT_357501 [Aspergillus heteromorphus CBS 117.55]|uniref:HRQ family protein 2 n=1 Tax=Aspergillus heteromorphus CBS 117.55 TaxID=1448321 RepID=A0A317X1F5_9EURO|nr:uncharacterized protein BO70DRAFT_357501 [Aspergillus heteromorphus CBS 117.55]PWY92383.1 hypothetical protein BO70DRAFT_357501 [Aspergillus heteromorphus CBS 117.55]
MDLDALVLHIQQNPTVVVFLVLALWLFGRWNRPSPSHPTAEKTPSDTTPAANTITITPLPSFDWETTEPTQFRPFKPKYHLSMGLTTTTFSDLIPIDKTYQDRLALRASLLSQHPSVVVGVTPAAETPGNIVHAAVAELYEFVVGEYLPTRYPSIFVLEDHPHHQNPEAKEQEGKRTLYNKITTQRIPTTLPGNSSRSALETLGTFVDEDFLVLMPESLAHPNPTSPSPSPSTSKEQEPEGGEGEKYILSAYSTFFPAGFDTREKLGQRLSTIHAPVPRYKEKLEKSMDRFFARLEVGRVVQRVNWSVTTQAGLFAAFGGVHGDEGKEEEVVEMGKEELVVEQTFLRCERQLLHRLPRTKALVFNFHTYTYPIQKIKEEGLGEELATAIDGLKEGNVPEIHRYKRGPVWGEAVKAFLRS